MLIVAKRTYKNEQLISGSGIFTSVANLFRRLLSSDLGRKAIDAAKTVGTVLATAGINTVKDVAIVQGKKLIASTGKPALTQNLQYITSKLANPDGGAGFAGAIAIQDLVKERMNGSGLQLI